MAIKANASSQGAGEFKHYIGVGSFRVLGVNPTKEELSKFYGREKEDPKYFYDKTDKNGKPYKSMRISFMIQADDPETVRKINKEAKESMNTNAALNEPFKTTINFFIDSRYRYSEEKGKYQIMDKYGRTAWATSELIKNHQIPIYSNGPARLDADYHPCYYGEEALTEFILNYLNVSKIEEYNTSTGQWITNPTPENCEGYLEHIKDYFSGDISELKGYCKAIPTNYVKLCVGVQTDDQGKTYNTVYSGYTMRNGVRSYTKLQNEIAKDTFGTKDTVFSDDATGTITNIHEYNANVKETDLSKPADVKDPFAPADDLPFGPTNEDNPFASVA